MNFKKFFSQFNIPAQCQHYGLPLWQCPQFLFLAMGIIIIGFTLIVYGIGVRQIEDPLIVVLIVLALTTILLLITFVIIQGFEKLAEANRMKSEFVSVVSHQLRSPLTNLRWAIELLMSEKLGKIEEKQAEYFMILKENNNRMIELISDLLTVSRIEQRKFPLKKNETSLEELIKGLILEFKPLILASNVKVEFEAEKNLPKVIADSSQISSVIENLLNNAIRYTPARQSPARPPASSLAGEVGREAASPMARPPSTEPKAMSGAAGGKDEGKVKIRLFKKGKKLYFEIEDNGVGIPEEDQKYIFQKFFRAKNITKYQTQGTGLGLYIAKAIIENSGGKIGFKSEENKGSTFWFTLPIKS